MGNYWLDLCEQEKKVKFKGKFQHAADLPRGRIYPYHPGKRSLSEKIDVGSMTEKALDEIRAFMFDAIDDYLQENNK